MLDGAANVAGDVYINFVNTTTANTITLMGSFGGTYGTYRGGSGADNVTFGVAASPMYFVGLLNGGDDTFTLESSTELDSLLVDFGAGTDHAER